MRKCARGVSARRGTLKPAPEDFVMTNLRCLHMTSLASLALNMELQLKWPITSSGTFLCASLGKH